MNSHAPPPQTLTEHPDARVSGLHTVETLGSPSESVLDRVLGGAPLAGALLGLALVTTHYFQALPSLRGMAANPVLVLVALETLHLAVMTVMWLRYQPIPMVDDDALPTLTVIIPAYNEGPMVERSIRSIAEADYPRDKIEILVVDDGSRDDTYFHMARLRQSHDGLVRLLRFVGNRGKRAALRAGFESARGDVVVTVDSDSEIERSTLRAMVSPFVRDARVGAVAGWVRVLNRDAILSRMLDVQFSLSFDFLRAAQSSFGTVFVCPGALSAFRRSVVLPALDAWLHQTFLGRPVGHGEDQALTNIVLRAGYDTVYQRTAVVWTLVPERYRPLTRMLTRWDRSYIVEGFSFARFMFTRYRTRGRVLPIVGFVTSTFRLVYVFLGLLSLPGAILRQPALFITGLAAAAAIATCTSLYYLRIARSPRFLWGVAYSFFSFFTLQWILPYALFTIRDERWGTR